jgi:toxin HigB-1
LTPGHKDFRRRSSPEERMNVLATLGSGQETLRNVLPDFRNAPATLRNVPRWRTNVPQVRMSVPQPRSSVPRPRINVPWSRMSVPWRCFGAPGCCKNVPEVRRVDSALRGHPEGSAYGLHGSLITLDVIILERYHLGVIRSFRDPETERLFLRHGARRLPSEIVRSALRKLVLLHSAESLQDLRQPPGNRLERLTRDREGQHSIRINDQWRICFVWKDGDAFEVEIVDYH